MINFEFMLYVQFELRLYLIVAYKLFPNVNSLNQFWTIYVMYRWNLKSTLGLEFTPILQLGPQIKLSEKL